MIALDASVVVAWYLDPDNALALALTEALADQDALAPGNLYAEVAQALMRAERLRKFSVDDLLGAAEDIASLPLIIETPSFARIVSVARRHSLSAYDAAYLCVAIDHDAPLATLDKTLSAAAKAEKVLWTPPRRKRLTN